MRSPSVNVAVTGNTITKNGGCDGCWDAGVSSQQAITAGNGHVEFRTSMGAPLLLYSTLEMLGSAVQGAMISY